MIVCDRCGVSNPDGSKFCKKCAKRLSESEYKEMTTDDGKGSVGNKCKLCRDPLHEQFTFCVTCGDIMCIPCGVLHNHAKEYTREYEYIVAKGTITYKFRFPRCTECVATEENAIGIIRERLRQYYPYKFRFLNVDNSKYGSMDETIKYWQSVLEWYRFPQALTNGIACPKCKAVFDAGEYRKMMKQLQQGENLLYEVFTVPFGEEGEVIPDVISCLKCGYSGVFINGWGLRKHLGRYGDRQLRDTIWFPSCKAFRKDPQMVSHEENGNEEEEDPNEEMEKKPYKGGDVQSLSDEEIDDLINDS